MAVKMVKSMDHFTNKAECFSEQIGIIKKITESVLLIDSNLFH